MRFILVGLIFFLLGSAATFWFRERFDVSISFRDGQKFSIQREGGKASSSIAAGQKIDWAALQKQVLPDEGFSLNVAYEDLGPKLVEVGAIDIGKFEENFASEGLTLSQKAVLESRSETPISIDQKSATFVVDFFWALGLANKSRVLDEGPMAKDPSALGNFASTGGWTLGSKKAVELFSKYEIVKLTDEQEQMVTRIANGVYRPCCGNSTGFPDCNHGMAALGLVQYLAYKGYSEEEIYAALLKFNSFWFPQNYLDVAAYFKLRGTDWTRVNPQLVLGNAYSSGQGYARLKQELDGQLGVQAPAGAGGRGCGT